MSKECASETSSWKAPRLTRLAFHIGTSRTDIGPIAQIGGARLRKISYAKFGQSTAAQIFGQELALEYVEKTVLYEANQNRSRRFHSGRGQEDLTLDWGSLPWPLFCKSIRN